MTETLHAQTRSLSRRSFLITVGGTGVAVAFGGLAQDAAAAVPTLTAEGPYRPNVWVTIAADGTVTIVCPASEMGQGVMTTLPLLIAEDMDADWAKVRVIQAPADAKNYGNPGFYGIQITGGSETTRGYYKKLRLVGAQTRKILVASAASILKVPARDLTTEPGKVIHKASGRSIGFGDIAKVGRLPDPLPEVTEADLKPAAHWRYIGQAALPRIDVPSKVTGSAIFGIDVQLPQMLYGAVLRPPVQGEKIEQLDDVAAKAVKGVTHIVPLPYGIGIIGETVEATRQAKELLKITWSQSSKVRGYSSDEVIEAYLQVGRDRSQRGVTMYEEADAIKAIDGAATIIDVDYRSDHVHHATMEPMNATALVTGDTVEIWAPTQGTTATVGFAAAAVGTTRDKVKVNTTLIGGAFGRRAEADFITDAALLAKAAAGRPVKVIWSREDDVQNGKYRPLESQNIQVGLDKSGAIVGWRHRIVAQSIFARTLPKMFEESGGKDDVVTEGSIFNYAVPAHLIEFVRQPAGPDVGFWRGVGHGYTRFAIECVIDEVAAALKVDPLAYRMQLLKEEPRAQTVLQAVAEMADWRRPRDGRALGLAYSNSFGAHCAQIVEVSLNRESGEIRVHHVWCAVDPGVAVQPLNIDAQISGAIIHGISHALFEQINFVKGEVQETNFDSYRVLRMSEVPEIDIKIMPTPENHPAGMGEVGLPPISPAIANAVARLGGGGRLRHLPFLPERVKASIKV